jgi:hypothetical protein
VLDAVAGIVRRTIRRSRSLTELAQSVQFEFEHPPDGPVILVHQMGCVGGISVERALLKRFPPANVYRTFFLNPASVRTAHARFGEFFHRTGEAGLPTEFLAARTLAGRFRGTVRAPWKVITLVRDPVARTLCAFFRRFRLNHPDFEPGFENDPGHVDRLADLFLEDHEAERGITLEWFDREVRAVFGIDVFAEPFPREVGQATFSADKCELLIVRTEDLGTVGARAISAFLDVPLLRVERHNETAGEPCAEAYGRFIEQVRLPAAWLDVMYGSRLARHFYDDAEIAAFRSRWSGG